MIIKKANQPFINSTCWKQGRFIDDSDRIEIQKTQKNQFLTISEEIIRQIANQKRR